jgi:plasmid stability protein
MASVTLKDIPEDIHAELRQAAAANHRSLQGEIIHRCSLHGDDGYTAQEVAALIEESERSGPEERLTDAQIQLRRKQIKARTRRRVKMLGAIREAA